MTSRGRAMLLTMTSTRTVNASLPRTVDGDGGTGGTIGNGESSMPDKRKK